MVPTAETVLQSLGVPLDSCGLFLDTARWLEASGGPAASSYWTTVDLPLVDRQRDEFFVAGALALIGAHLVAAEPGGSDWRIRYGGAYLFETKPLAQTIRSIDLLCSARCYVDAISVVRTLQSRVQLLVLFSLGPHLFDEWLVDSSAKKFRDGEVRKELAAHSLDIFPHLYHWFSDVVHGRGEGLEDAGHFEKGLFPSVPAVHNMILVAAKLLLGVAGWTVPSALAVDAADIGHSAGSGVMSVLRVYDSLFEGVLHPARHDHLWTTIPQDRHWPDARSDTTTHIRWFAFEDYSQLLRELHYKDPARSLGVKYTFAMGEST